MLRTSTVILLTTGLLAGCKTYDPTSHLGGGGSAGGAAAPDTGGDPNAVVATIDGEEITLADLEKNLRPQLSQIRAQYYQQLEGLREQGLEQLIDRRLIERKAKAAGLTDREYFDKEVMGAIPDPSDEEIRGVYDQVLASGRELPPFEQVQGDIKSFLKSQQGEGAIEAFQQKLRAEAKVTKSLPPLLLPKVDLSRAKGPSKGDASAPVTIVEFSDYECGFCKRADPTVAEVLAAYPGKVRVVMAHYPLPSHPGAQKAAEAALCADDQGKHWEMHAKMFENNEALAIDDLKKYAGEVGLDAAKFAACLDGGAKAPQVKEFIELGDEVGVAGTPAFFVNGRPLSGGPELDAFKKLIDMELADKT